MPDPIPVIPLEYAKAERRLRPAWRGIVRVCCVLSLLCCAVAWSLLFWEVESVVLTGAILFSLGSLLTIGGAMLHDWRVVAFGGAHAFTCALFVALVNLRSWSPAEAEQPFIVMGAAHTVAAFVAAAVWRPALWG